MTAHYRPFTRRANLLLSYRFLGYLLGYDKLGHTRATYFFILAEALLLAIIFARQEKCRLLKVRTANAVLEQRKIQNLTFPGIFGGSLWIH